MDQLWVVILFVYDDDKISININKKYNWIDLLNHTIAVPGFIQTLANSNKYNIV